MTTPVPLSRAVLDIVLRHDLAAFVERAFATLNPAARFMANWHIHCICWHLEQVALGNIKRLIINLPPRHLKSFSCSVAFPAWVLGRTPTQKIICASYSRELAVELSGDFRRLVRTPFYQHLFPGVFTARLKNTEELQLTASRGSRLATSVGGTLTGLGGNIMILDDLLKADASMSEADRRSVNTWLRNTLVPRLDDKREGAIVLTMQRFHEDDPTGHLIAEDGHGWTHINIPATAPEDCTYRIGNAPRPQFYDRAAGEVLDAEREPQSVLDQIRTEIGSDRFEAQYQGNPLPPGGHIFKRHWLVTCEEAPDLWAMDAVVQSWDTAMSAEEHNDFSVCTTWAVAGNSCYLIDVFRKRVEFVELRSAALELIDRFRPNVVIIEKAGHGIGLRQELRRQLQRRSNRPILFDPIPRGDKATRAAGVSAMVERGMIAIPERARFRTEFEKEVLSFPSSKHDDQVDSLVQFLRYLQILRAPLKFDRETGRLVRNRR